MLLSLWPGETDPASAATPDGLPAPAHHIPLKDRQYLLVYYVPFDTTPAKKKTRSSQMSSGDSLASTLEERDVLLPAFHVSARLVGYEEQRGSGVRLPSDGLRVTGALADALRAVPAPAVRAEECVIGVCSGRESGIEFQPEGLVKMGLCLPAPAPDPAAAAGALGEEETEALLSPIGRAAVEMAWVGCMAVTSFGTA